MELFFVFLGIIGAFVLLLIIKAVTSLRFCVACVSVAGAWITLLALYWLDIFENTILLALLIGQSIVGIYYLAEKHLPERYQIFRIPFLLSLTFSAYSVLASVEFAALWLLVGLWIISGLLYAYRTQPKLKSTAEHILACCKDW